LVVPSASARRKTFIRELVGLVTSRGLVLRMDDLAWFNRRDHSLTPWRREVEAQ